MTTFVLHVVGDCGVWQDFAIGDYIIIPMNNKRITQQPSNIQQKTENYIINFTQK